MSGASLSRLYFDDVVRPAVVKRWPGMPYAAGRLGSGSDVLGYDDRVSQDHDWGLRLSLFVPADMVVEVDNHLDLVLPGQFQGYPVRFATTWEPHVRHRVHVDDVETFVASRTGISAVGEPSIADWLSLTGQAVLEVTAGPVFVDTAGEITAVRERLAWYPGDVWIYVVATDWARLGEELPLIGRAAEHGDHLGSQVIAARLVAVTMHLAHLLERQWPPYSKWIGTSLTRLPRAAAVSEPIHRAVSASDWRIREGALVDALRVLHQLQGEVRLPRIEQPIGPFWDRPYRTVREDVLTALEDCITDPEVRALPRGVGSAEQWSNNVRVLVDPTQRLVASKSRYLSSSQGSTARARAAKAT